MPATPRTHHDLTMAGRAQVWIAVPPDVVYAAVADLPRMGEWSPENRGGDWLESDEIALGATFLGRNRGAHGEWETIATIIEVEPERCIAFRAAPPGQPGTTWRFTFAPARSGTDVTESFEWEWTPLPKDGFRGRVGQMTLDDAIVAVEERRRHLQASIRATLAALKAGLEATSFP